MGSDRRDYLDMNFILLKIDDDGELGLYDFHDYSWQR
jgi:calpain-15